MHREPKPRDTARYRTILQPMKKLFRNDRRNSSRQHNRVYARFEIAHTLADFLAAVCFVIGSVMFFFEAWQTPGTWLFLIGSLLFALKPSLRLAREITLYRMGDMDDLAQAAQWEGKAEK